VIPRYAFPDGYSISRIIKGGWHLAGDHGVVDPRQAREDMVRFVEAGITTFDCADIYAGVEVLIGSFQRAFPSLASQTQIHTKFVPDLSDLRTLDRAYVERVIDRSLTRLGMERLDLVQFHWWDFDVPGYVETALELERLRRAGKIARVGVTNFDTPHLLEILGAGAAIAAHQLQYSLMDSRPAKTMVAACRDYGIPLLCYGTVCGGFLSERWLGEPPPTLPLQNRSLIKYNLIIQDFGGWTLFQELLTILAAIAAKYETDLASVATRAVLDFPGVAAAIVGATSAVHLAAHSGIGAIRLDTEDLRAIASVTDRRRGPQGEVYELERDQAGPHGRIMKYELNNALPESSGS
jgi:aryl-alcohol dehydrogenase-like predicted oxidoreductase